MSIVLNDLGCPLSAREAGDSSEGHRVAGGFSCVGRAGACRPVATLPTRHSYSDRGGRGRWKGDEKARPDTVM